MARRSRIVQGIAPQLDPLAKALRELAAAKPDVVIAHGGQNNDAAKLVATELPDTRFVVTQGNVTGPNLASYEVLQELSAYLAGVLAALMTKTGIVAHLSGIKFASTLKARAAYANGIAETNPKVRLLTGFTGSMDDGAAAKRATLAMADAGADIVFTMLNAARGGAIEGCREKKIQQIGNVVDWPSRVPDVFIASAIADAGLAVFSAAARDRRRQLQARRRPPDRARRPRGRAARAVAAGSRRGPRQDRRGIDRRVLRSGIGLDRVERPRVRDTSLIGATPEIKPVGRADPDPEAPRTGNRIVEGDT